jgi:plastocyanin
MKADRVILYIVAVVYTIITIQASDAGASGRPDVTTNPQMRIPATRPATVNVKIDNFTFQPREIQILAGTTVTWQNADDVPHTATSKGDPQTFDSGALDTDDKFSFTFSKPGKYAYYCKVHPHMTGVITVK